MPLHKFQTMNPISIELDRDDSSRKSRTKTVFSDERKVPTHRCFSTYRLQRYSSRYITLFQQQSNNCLFPGINPSSFRSSKSLQKKLKPSRGRNFEVFAVSWSTMHSFISNTCKVPTLFRNNQLRDKYRGCLIVSQSIKHLQFIQSKPL